MHIQFQKGSVEDMSESTIKEMQTSALCRINFCFKKLKETPPLLWKNDVIDNESIEISRKNYRNLSPDKQAAFNKIWYQYMDRESTTEARVMLIVNYLSALLIKGKNNQISIHRNFADKMPEIQEFETNNKELLLRLQAARDKLYAHIDLDWKKYAKEITFDEFQICIDFLNKLLGIRSSLFKR